MRRVRQNIFKNLFDGIKAPLRPRDLEESGPQKEQMLKKVIFTFVATFLFADLKVKADRLNT